MPYIKRNEAEDMKRRICALYNNNEDWRPLSKELGVKRSTAYHWVKNQKNKQRGGKRRSIITAEHCEFISKYIEEYPSLTLKQLQQKFQANHQIFVSKECLRNHLNGLIFSIKDNPSDPEKMNTDENKLKRHDIAQKLLEFESENILIIYIDSTNFNLFMSRHNGKSKNRSRCTFIAAGSRGINVHLMGCIGIVGLISYGTNQGAFTELDTMEFVKNCLRNTYSIYERPVALVINDALYNKSIENIFEEEEFCNHKLLKLDPYSTLFNAMEYVWPNLKHDIRNQLTEEMAQILADEYELHTSEAECTVINSRAHILENIIQDNINKITINDCNQYIANIQMFIPDALNLNDMDY